MTEAQERLALFGEDLADLLADLETSFWIEFSEEDLVECSTAGQLFDRILSRMGPLGEPRCLSAAAFYRLRRSLAGMTGQDRRTIRPGTPLKDLLPWRGRKHAWEALETDLRVGLPRLQAKGEVQAVAAVLALAIGCATARRLVEPGLPIQALGSAFLVWLMVWLGCMLLTSPFHREFPSGVITVGDLARFVALRNHKKMAQEAGGTTVGQAWRAFQEILGAHSRISPDEIRRDMRFPEDLNLCY